MNKPNKTVTLADRIAAIEASKAEWNARCDALIAASLARDLRITTLLGR